MPLKRGCHPALRLEQVGVFIGGKPVSTSIRLGASAGVGSTARPPPLRTFSSASTDFRALLASVPGGYLTERVMLSLSTMRIAPSVCALVLVLFSSSLLAGSDWQEVGSIPEGTNKWFAQRVLLQMSKVLGWEQTEISADTSQVRKTVLFRACKAELSVRGALAFIRGNCGSSEKAEIVFQEQVSKFHGEWENAWAVPHESLAERDFVAHASQGAPLSAIQRAIASALAGRGWEVLSVDSDGVRASIDQRGALCEVLVVPRPGQVKLRSDCDRPLSREKLKRWLAYLASDISQNLAAYIPSDGHEPAGTSSVESRLRSLERLRAKGLVSEDEFEEQRQRILSEL